MGIRESNRGHLMAKKYYYVNDLTGQVIECTKFEKEAHNSYMSAKQLENILSSPLGLPSIMLGGPLIAYFLFTFGYPIIKEFLDKDEGNGEDGLYDRFNKYISEKFDFLPALSKMGVPSL